MKILVTGAGGQLGRAVVEEFSGPHEVVALTRTELDVSAPTAVRETCIRLHPDAIINCAAYTDVDGAEEDAATALDGNALAVRALALAAREIGAALVHYSTDFVFDGEASAPYAEDDAPNPKSVYAASKLLGEWLAADVPVHYVLRVESLFGGPLARSSIDRIIDAVNEDREARVFVDRTVTPSYVVDVARATQALLDHRAPGGLYHCVNSGATTWYQVGQEIARLLHRPARLVPVSVADVVLRASRPRYCALSNRKLANVGVEMPPWQDALARYVELLRIRALAGGAQP